VAVTQHLRETWQPPTLKGEGIATLMSALRHPANDPLRLSPDQPLGADLAFEIITYLGRRIDLKCWACQRRQDEITTWATIEPDGGIVIAIGSFWQAERPGAAPHIQRSKPARADPRSPMSWKCKCGKVCRLAPRKLAERYLRSARAGVDSIIT
jgi:hypothetical protein